ncbi:MAG: cytochrome c oxidase assembly protein [Chloroflexota bacterium]
MRMLARSAALALAALAVPSAVFAHGDAGVAPTVDLLFDGWSFDLDLWLPVILMAIAYWAAANRVDGRHPQNTVPRWRRWSWLAGLAVIVLAVASPLGFYDTTLFSVHMVQHLLLTMVAAPLLVLAAPITLLLRVATPEARQRWILPVLHSRLVRVISHPFVTWGVFAVVMWFSHFSPLFDAALDNELLHRFEHLLYLGAGMLFWWPVVGADPSPHRLKHPGRIFYLGLGMPFSSFLGLVIFSAVNVLYGHYETLQRDWGPTPLEDQALAGGIMWAGGDLVFVIALVLAGAGWLRHEEREGRRVDARLARARASPREASATPSPPDPARVVEPAAPSDPQVNGSSAGPR